MTFEITPHMTVSPSSFRNVLRRDSLDFSEQLSKEQCSSFKKFPNDFPASDASVGVVSGEPRKSLSARCVPRSDWIKTWVWRSCRNSRGILISGCRERTLDKESSESGEAWKRDNALASIVCRMRGVITGVHMRIFLTSTHLSIFWKLHIWEPNKVRGCLLDHHRGDTVQKPGPIKVIMGSAVFLVRW